MNKTENIFVKLLNIIGIISICVFVFGGIDENNVMYSFFKENMSVYILIPLVCYVLYLYREIIFLFFITKKNQLIADKMNYIYPVDSFSKKFKDNLKVKYFKHLPYVEILNEACRRQEEIDKEEVTIDSKLNNESMIDLYNRIFKISIQLNREEYKNKEFLTVYYAALAKMFKSYNEKLNTSKVEIEVKLFEGNISVEKLTKLFKSK